MKSHPPTGSGHSVVKKGLALERLVTWIQKSLHRDAVVTHDDTLPDKDTGEPRQIDVSIRVPTGKEEFLAIVEVRDRSSKVDSTYIEQVKSKRESVGADAAFIVSKAGFTGPALIKAEKNGIRTFTLDEASEADWSAWISARTFGVVEQKFAPSLLLLGKKGTENVLDLSEDTLDAFRADPTTKIVLTTGGKPYASLPDLIHTVVNYFTGNKLVEVPKDGSRVGRSLLFQGTWKPPLFVKSAAGTIEEVGSVRVDAELWWETVEFPVTLRRYRKSTSDETSSHAEIMETDAVVGGRKVKFQLLAETDGTGVKGGSLLSLRHVADDEE